MESNAQRMSDLLEELIELTEKRFTDKTRRRLEEILFEIAGLENLELRRIFGISYKNVDFDIYNKNEQNRGFFKSNIVRNKKGKIEKQYWPPKIRINLYHSLNDKRLFSDRREDRIAECLELVDTIFHEFRHYYQSLRAQSIPRTIDDVNFAKEELLETIDYDNAYTANYWVYNNEIDARIFANNRLKGFIGNIRDYWTRTYISRMHERLNNVSEEDYLNKYLAVYREGPKGYHQDKENYINDKLSSFIKANPNVVEIYKALKVEYKRNGAKKSCIELISDFHDIILHLSYKANIPEDKKESIKQKLQKMYFELIGNELINLSKRDEKKLISSIGKRNLDYLFSLMENYYSVELNTQLQMLERLRDLRLKEKIWDSYEAAKERVNFQIRYNMIRAKYQRRLQKISEYKYNYDIQSHELINGVDLEYIEPVILDDMQRRQRTYTLGEMVRTYDNFENIFLFGEREKREKELFSEVLNAVKYQRCSIDFIKKFLTVTDKNISKEQVLEVLRLLKAADTLTIYGGEDFLEELADVPFINDIIDIVKRSDAYRELWEDSRAIRRILPYRTEAEKDKKMAENYLKYGKLKSRTAEDEVYRYGFNGDPEMVYNDDFHFALGRVAIWKVTARQQGYDVSDIIGVLFGARINGPKQGLITYEQFRQFAQDERVKKTMINGKVYDAIRNISPIKKDNMLK